MIRVKVYIKPEIRRFTITKETTLSNFTKLLKECCPEIANVDKPIFMYQDDENDWITFSTSLEWEEAIKYHDDGKILRLKVKLPTSSPQQQQQEKEEKDNEDIKHNFHHHHHHHMGGRGHRGCGGRGRKLFEKLHHHCPKFQKSTECKNLGFETKPGDYVVDLSSLVHDAASALNLNQENVKPEDIVHFRIICDGCGQKDIRGTRYHCKQCPDFDYCSKCIETQGKSHCGGFHSFEKITKSKFSILDRIGNIVTHIINEDAPQQPQPQTQTPPKEEKQEVKNEVKVVEPPNVEEQKSIVPPSVESPKQPVLASFEPPKLPDNTVLEPNTQQQPLQTPTSFSFEPKKVVEPEPVKPKEIEKPKETPDKYAVHLQILESMGFGNVDLNVFLLNKHQGNLQRAVDELISLQQ